MEQAPKEALVIDKNFLPCLLLVFICSQARVGPRLVHTPYTQRTDKYQYDQYVRLFTDRRTVRGRVLVQAVFGDSVLRNYLPA